MSILEHAKTSRNALNYLEDYLNSNGLNCNLVAEFTFTLELTKIEKIIKKIINPNKKP